LRLPPYPIPQFTNMNSNLLFYVAVFTIGFDATVSKPSPKFSVENVVGGDIRYDPKQRNAGKAARLWINGQVPYTIDPALPEYQVRVIMDAIKEYEGKTCVRLIPKTDQHKDYIRFMNGGDGQCYSSLGRQIGGQDLSLGRWCDSLGTAQHEIMHALGFNHEHNRPDRDNYVKVRFDRLEKGGEGQFRKLSPFSVKDLNLRYDYLSIMHYSRSGYSTGGDTIETLDKTYQDRIGNRDTFTQCDLEKINRFYECKNYIQPNNPCKDSAQPPVALTYQTIESLMHGKLLNVEGGLATPGTRVVLYPKQDANSANDHFAFKNAKNGYFYIESAVSSNVVLDIDGGINARPGAQVILMPVKNLNDPAVNSQLWRWNGQTIESALGNLVLNVYRASKEDLTPCIVYPRSGFNDANELWRLSN